MIRRSFLVGILSGVAGFLGMKAKASVTRYEVPMSYSSTPINFVQVSKEIQPYELVANLIREKILACLPEGAERFKGSLSLFVNRLPESLIANYPNGITVTIHILNKTDEEMSDRNHWIAPLNRERQIAERFRNGSITRRELAEFEKKG